MFDLLPKMTKLLVKVALAGWHESIRLCLLAIVMTTCAIAVIRFG